MFHIHGADGKPENKKKNQENKKNALCVATAPHVNGDKMTNGDKLASFNSVANITITAFTLPEPQKKSEK